MHFTYARFSIFAWLEAIETSTTVTPLQVDAMALTTKAGIQSAFVDILAVTSGPDLLITRGTNAHERADQVLALELAGVGEGALVDVCGQV